MKTIGRILIILFAAGIVITGTWALTRHSANPQFERSESRFRPEGEFEQEEFDSERPDQFQEEINSAGTPQNFMDYARSLKRQIGRFIPLGMIKDFGIVSVIVGVFVSTEYLFDRKRKNRVVKVPHDSSTV